jgi:hypothetical protein
VFLTQVMKHEQQGQTYVLTSSSLKSPPLLIFQDVIDQESLNKSLSLLFVFPIKIFMTPESISLDMSFVLSEFYDVFFPPKGVPP